jgi:hypothetical protein
MAKDFNVQESFLDQELFYFISKHKIQGQIDFQSKVIDTTKQDPRISLYTQMIHKGDHLIERVHKLVKIAIR